jgi:hypothetical protein
MVTLIGVTIPTSMLIAALREVVGNERCQIERIICARIAPPHTVGETSGICVRSAATGLRTVQVLFQSAGQNQR